MLEYRIVKTDFGGKITLYNVQYRGVGLFWWIWRSLTYYNHYEEKQKVSYHGTLEEAQQVLLKHEKTMQKQKPLKETKTYLDRDGEEKVRENR